MMKSGNSAMVRRINREVIRDALKTRANANIAELSRLTGLSPATCANIIPELVGDGEVFELEERQSRGGRPARLYAYNPNHTQVATLLLQYAEGRTHIRHSVRNSMGDSVSGGDSVPEPFAVDALDAVLDGLLRDFPAVKAVAVSVPGVVNNDGVVEMCDIAELSDVALEKHLRDRYSLVTVTENDMNLAAVGYQSRHAAATATGIAFVNIPVEKCPGCGIVVGGELLKGKSNFAGELAYIPFAGEPPGVPGGIADSGKTAVERAAQLCCALAASVNPDEVVIAGDAMREDMTEEIREWCLRYIPDRHLPKITVKRVYDEDCFAGMVAMALEGLSCDVRLVERKR